MAGAGRAQRGRFTSAGYAYDEELESELYLEHGAAEFTRELIRDNHRIGYSEQALDEDGLPFFFFNDEEERDEERTHTKKHKKQALETMTFTERLTIAVRRERRAVAVCCVLLVLNATLLAFWGQAAIEGVRKRDRLAELEADNTKYETEIRDARAAIDAAQKGERIRNVAQNELGMLREELVTKKTIYIQAPVAQQSVPQAEETQERSGLLDWMLSVADIFDFSR